MNEEKTERFIRIDFDGPMEVPKVTATLGLREREFAIASRVLWAVADEHLKDESRRKSIR
jgi:hypothetical protein